MASDLFIILSEVSRDWSRSWALTAAGSDGAGPGGDWGGLDCRVGIAPARYGDNQLWRRHGTDGKYWFEAVALRHPEAGGVGGALHFSGVQGQGPVRVVPFEPNAQGFYWDVDVALASTPILAKPWGDQLLEVAGNGPYDERSRVCVYEYDRHHRDHQTWRFRPYRPSFSAPRIAYRTRSLAPNDSKRVAVETFDNRGGKAPRLFSATLSGLGAAQHRWRTDVGSEQALACLTALGGRIELDEVASFRRERLQLSCGLEPRFVGAPAGLVLGVDVSAAVGVRGQITVEIEVPAETRYEVSLDALQATFKADWRAAIDRLAPDRATAATYDLAGSYEVSGVFDFALRVEEPLVGGKTRRLWRAADHDVVSLSRG